MPKTFQQTHRDLLRERCDRLCKLVELNAPPAVLEFTAEHTIRAIVYAVGPEVLGGLGKYLVRIGKEQSGVCGFCPEERPINARIGMCNECARQASEGDEEAEALVRLAEEEDEEAEARRCIECGAPGDPFHCLDRDTDSEAEAANG